MFLLKKFIKTSEFKALLANQVLSIKKRKTQVIITLFFQQNARRKILQPLIVSFIIKLSLVQRFSLKTKEEVPSFFQFQKLTLKENSV